MLAVVFACLLLATGCESMFDSIGDRLTHDSDVKHYENLGYSHDRAERRVFEDNIFDEQQ